ncbi:MEDS domain-containing protein [Alicyclobacillus curvatus]|nr:MEDS domain-containing protein [Alicyclobacillus curvatus]
MSTHDINIKQDFRVQNGAHILYLFQHQTSYIENLMSYVTDGLAQGHFVVIVDKSEVYQELVRRLSMQFSEEELQSIFFEDSRDFYNVRADFHIESIVDHFGQFISSLPAPSSQHAVRTWARVAWREQPNITAKIEEFEQVADHSVKGQQLVSVCAYDSKEIDADLLVKLQRSHDYFMTDTELISSPLYYSKQHNFPSLAVHSKIESELNVYKSKLDFAHVIAHEVRNPLTIINGYANLIQAREPNLSPDSVNKLVAIGHYVDGIVQELTHLIETEQVLAEDLYMHLESIDPLDVVHHVIELMKVKSMVQNVDFKWSMESPARCSMLGNRMGLRLILSNVLSNAIKYTDEQGTVEFHTETSDNQIRFTVRDNGIGMSSEQLNLLYHKYAKFNDVKSGQGIGLYVVKSLTDRFKGQIRHESELGRGTTVTIEFPLYDEK